MSIGKKIVGRSVSDRVFDLVVTLLVFSLVVVLLYPFLYTISLSLSRPSAILAGRVRLFPVGTNTVAYAAVLRRPGIIRAFGVSTFYVVAGTASLLIMVSLTAYPCSLRDFRPRKAVMLIALFTMVFNGGMVPTFLWIRALGLLNTIWAIILPASLTAWYVIIFRTFLQQQPESMRESALIDGAGEWRILVRIVLPLSKPIIATLCVFHMVYHWNSFFPALLYLRSEALMPVQMLLRRVLAGAASVEEIIRDGDERLVMPESIQAAFVVVTALPIVLVYPFAQRYFTKGIMIGAIKG